MTTRASPREHFLLPWAVQEREDPVLVFDHADGVSFFDRERTGRVVGLVVTRTRAWRLLP
jgi:hypothetical protein